MDAEETIAEIERLERIFALPDTRPLSPNDLSAANRKHDERLAHSPTFRLWRQFGVAAARDGGTAPTSPSAAHQLVQETPHCQEHIPLQSNTGFSAEIVVDDLGLVITYSGGRERIAAL